MRGARVLFILLLVVAFIASGTSIGSASSAGGIPIKAAVLIDEEYASTDSHSPLFEGVKKGLNVNKMPFDVLDISKIDEHTFLDRSSDPRYSVLLVLSAGWRIDSTNSKLIIDAADKGMGVVGMTSDSANTDLMPILGIDKLGTEWLGSDSLQIIKDGFTFSYQGEIVDGASACLNHQLLRDAEVVAKFVGSGEPALWTYRYGAAKTVFHNHTIAWDYQYRGILLQSILYAMPIGVACPINAGVIEVDDCPRSFYSATQLQDWHYTFYLNFTKWLQTYNFTASFFIAFSYAGDVSDFWVHPESLECANDIIKSGYELGLHCGNKHIPLKVAYWGDQATIDTEVDNMMQALDLLRKKLYQEYGTQLGEIVSYVAPTSEIGDYGYEALDTRTGIKYVGTNYFPADQATTRDFGWERDLDIYNLPRTQSTFYGLNQPQSEQYSLRWGILRSVIESGDSYLIFTHPDELELLDTSQFPNASMSDLFEGCKVWGDYVSQHYPFYRWWTSSELGQYLEQREGVLDAEWFPQDSILKLKLSQPNDAIHIKTHEYLNSISQTGETIDLTFSSSPCDFNSDNYDVVYLNQDYFIYPKDSKSSRPVTPETPFTFKPNTQDENELPLLALLSGTIAGVILITGTLLIRRMSKK